MRARPRRRDATARTVQEVAWTLQEAARTVQEAARTVQEAARTVQVSLPPLRRHCHASSAAGSTNASPGASYGTGHCRRTIPCRGTGRPVRGGRFYACASVMSAARDAVVSSRHSCAAAPGDPGHAEPWRVPWRVALQPRRAPNGGAQRSTLRSFSACEFSALASPQLRFAGAVMPAAPREAIQLASTVSVLLH